MKIKKFQGWMHRCNFSQIEKKERGYKFLYGNIQVFDKPYYGEEAMVKVTVEIEDV